MLRRVAGGTAMLWIAADCGRCQGVQAESGDSVYCPRASPVGVVTRLPQPCVLMAELREIELVFEPQEEGGYHVYAPELPGLHTQGEDLDDAMANAEEAVALYVEGLRAAGGTLETGVIPRKIALPA